MKDKLEPGEMSHIFVRKASKAPPHHDAGELTREFNYAEVRPEDDHAEPSLEHNLEAPGLGGAPAPLSIEEQRASRMEELQASLSQQFNRTSKKRANEPELGR